MGERSWWSEERVKRLKELALQNLSFTEIGAELGGLSRNAVAGKMHRLGLSTKSTGPRRRRSSPPPPAAPAEAVPQMTEAPVVVAELKTVERIFLEDAPTVTKRDQAELMKLFNASRLPSEERRGATRAVLSLAPGQECRFPIGDPKHPDFHFCCAKPAHNSPYCERHDEIVYDGTLEERAKMRAARQVRALAMKRDMVSAIQPSAINRNVEKLMATVK